MELNRDLYIDGVSDYLEQQENLYNSSTDTTNSYINSEGEVISLSTWRVTDYIPVTPGSTFYYEGLINNGVAPMSAFYNSSKQFISSFKQVQGINNITIPSGARYIRFSLNNSDINLFKFDNRRYYGKYASKNYLENGKNLWNYNATNKIVGVTSTYNNSTLTLNGTATGEASNISHTNMVYLNAGTYTFKIVKESGSATGSQAIIFKNYTTNTNILNTTLNLSSGNTVTFTLENSAWVSLAIYFFASNVFTNLKLDIQLEEGSSATPYEEYYGKYITENYLTNGKNKANIPTHTVAGQGTDYRIVNIEQNTTYTLSCLKTRISGVTITNGSLIMFVKFDFYNGSTKISSASLPSAVSFTTGARYLTYTFTAPANCDNILLNLGNNNGDNNRNTSVSNVMLNKGTSALPYEEYYEKYLNKGDGILIPYTLYENESGTSGNITLSDYVKNYKFVEIYYRSENFIKTSLKFEVGQDVNNITLYTLQNSNNGASVFLNTRTLTVSGTSIATLATNRYSVLTIASSGISSYNNNNNIYITKVIGYK